MQSFQFSIPKGMQAVISDNGQIVIRSIRPSKQGFFKIKKIKAKAGVIPMEETLILQNPQKKWIHVKRKSKTI